MMHLPEKKDYRLNFEEILFIFIFIFQSVNFSAQDEIPDSVVIGRIECIQNMLGQSKPNANLWWYGWLAGYGAATVVQGAVYFAGNDQGTRQDMALGASITFLGAMGQLVTPLNPGKKAEMLAHISDSTSEDRLKKLSDAEEFLKATAIREKLGISWKTHALFTTVNAGSGLITWLGFKRSVWAGVGNFALNTVITEIRIWTQPTRAIRDYQNYCSKYKSGITPVVYKSKPTCYVCAYPGGITIRIMF
jgi:hypothetical protein